MNILYILLTPILLGSTISNIINYSNEEYVLLEDTDNIFLYETYGELFHVTNLSFYKYIIEEELKYVKDRNISVDWDFYLNVKLASSLFSQLTPHKIVKRGINELGTIFKWITGTPDHNDLITLQNKINDLVENNNKQNQINSAIFKEIQKVTNLLENLKSDEEFAMKKQRLKLLSFDLQNLRDAITFSKANILYSKILNNHDVADIFTHEKFNITIIDLMDVSIFSIISHKGLIIYYIKYPIVKHSCKFFHAKAISQTNGKLIIDDKVAKCNDTYYPITFKKEIYNNFGQIQEKDNCFVDMLNKKYAVCKKIKEKNKPVEIITDGAILVSGSNYINHTFVTGIYLVTFQFNVDINNITYTNNKQKLLNYIENNRFKNYLISEYLQSNNSELKFQNTNILSKIIIPLKHNHIEITFVIILIMLVFCMSKLLKYLFPNLFLNIFNFIKAKYSLVTKRNTIQKSDVDSDTLKSLSEKVDQISETL